MLYLLISMSILNGFCHAIHTQIGHYPNVSDERCGFGKMGDLMDDSCFEWHQTFDISSKIINGRDITTGELPFVVYIAICRIYSINNEKKYAECTGAIINSKWIITAAHCFECNGTVFHCPHPINEHQVYIGVKGRNQIKPDNPVVKYYKMKHIYIHPEHQTKRLIDIAVIRLTEEIVFTDRLNVSSICLPTKDIINREDEYAIISGWGVIDLEGKHFPNILQIGWTRIYADIPHSDSAFLVIAKRIPFPGGAATCGGDSGGPFLQYVNGRAVLIGMSSGYTKVKNDSVKCTPEHQDSAFYGPRISYFIDWIVNVTEN